MFGIVDIILVIALLLAVLAGVRSGLFASLGTIAGLVVGALAMPWLLPWAAGLLPEEWRGVGVILAAVLLLAVGAAIGSGIGRWLRRGADRLSLRVPERVLGGAVGLIAAALVISLLGAGVTAAGIPGISSAVASSTVLRTIERLTPRPVDEALARARSGLLEVSALPTIDGLIDDADLALAPDLENVDIDDPEIAAAAGSVARISGLAAACGTVPSGTGFVVADGMVMTNAHVIAGVSTPMVELPGQPARDGQVVYFDPVDDLAVIAADIQAPPLPLTEAAAPGDSAVVHGYPYGGPPSTVPAGVAATGTFRVPDIYGQSPAERSVITLRAEVESGNSGGPALSPDGEVIGVIFARDEVREDIGYALASSEVAPVVEAVDSTQDPVPTGECAA